MDRITEKDLAAVVNRINEMTGSPETSYTTYQENGKKKWKANPGNYHLQSAYGGHGLVRMCNEGGGVESIIGGYMPKRELYEKMQVFINGYGLSKKE